MATISRCSASSSASVMRRSDCLRSPVAVCSAGSNSAVSLDDQGSRAFVGKEFNQRSKALESDHVHPLHPLLERFHRRRVFGNMPVPIAPCACRAASRDVGVADNEPGFLGSARSPAVSVRKINFSA